MRTVHRLTGLLSGIVLAAGCTASSEDVRPPNGDDGDSESPIFFPTGAAVAPDESVLFVANANSELRYDSGSIAVFPLPEIDKAIEDWIGAGKIVPPGCEPDGDHVETLTCDAKLFIASQSGVRLGNFATEIAIQDMMNGELRLFVPTRGDPSVAWITWDGTRLSCSAGTEGFGLCDDDHRLSFVLDDADLLSLPEEPFGVFADTAGEFAMVTHLTTGAVTLIDSPRDGAAQITDVVATAFGGHPSTGFRGATGIAGRTPRATDDIVYVGSRYEDRIQTFTVGRPVNGAPPFLLLGDWFFLDAVGGNTGDSADTRGMTFSESGERLYLVNRQPPTLQVYDTSIGPTGFPKNQPLGATEICRQASTLTIAGSGDDERLYVTCFSDGQLYIVDPRGESQTEDIITVGRGPYSVAAARTRKKLYVTNFLEDTIAVIDIDPASPMRNRVVLRIGLPRQL